MEPAPTSKHRMRFGEGRISGVFAIAFGAMSLGGVLCFLYPEYLTTPEFRGHYDVEVLRGALGACIAVGIASAVRSLTVNPSKLAGLIGGGLTLAALALGGTGIDPGEVGDARVYLSLDYLVLSLLAMALLFVPLELLYPKHTQQTKFHPEWKTDLVYFIVAHLLVQWLAMLSQEPVRATFGGASLAGIHASIGGLPFLIQVLLAVLVADLFQYAIHRLFHRLPYLWRFHSVHHSTRTMDWLAGSRLHLIDVIATRMMVYLPLYLLGFDQRVLLAYVAIVATQAALNHTNTRLPFRWLEPFLVSPRIHHWHHSTLREAHDKNFAVHFPWIDRLFGTYHAPGDQWPEAVGLEGVAFPKGYLAQLVYPFRRDPGAAEPDGEPSSR